MRQVVLGRARAVAELANEPLPIRRHARGDRKTVCGVVDGGLQHAIQWPSAMSPEDFAPGFDRARYVDRVRRGRLECAQPLRQQCLGWGFFAGTAAAVVAPDRLALLGNQGEAVTADT